MSNEWINQLSKNGTGRYSFYKVSEAHYRSVTGTNIRVSQFFSDQALANFLVVTGKVFSTPE